MDRSRRTRMTGLAAAVAVALVVGATAPAWAATNPARTTAPPAVPAACAAELAGRQSMLSTLTASVAKLSFLPSSQRAMLANEINKLTAQVGGVASALAAATTADQVRAACQRMAPDRLMWNLVLPRLLAPVLDAAARVGDVVAAVQKLVAAVQAARAAGVNTSVADAALATANARLNAMGATLRGVNATTFANPAALAGMWASLVADGQVVLNSLASVVVFLALAGRPVTF